MNATKDYLKKIEEITEQTLQKNISDAITKIAELSKIIDINEEKTFCENTSVVLGKIKNEINSIRDKNEFLQVLLFLENVNSRIKKLKHLAKPDKNEKKSASSLSKLINEILNIIKNLSSNLFQLLLNLINPTSWSIGGTIGANLFIFSGNVHLTLTFG